MENEDIVLEENLDQDNVILDDSQNASEDLAEEEVQEEQPEVALESDLIEQPEEDKKSNDSSFHLRELRRRYRELKRENYELKRHVPANVQEVPQIYKPTLSECDYDEEEYEKRVLQWHEHQRRQKENDELRRREEDAEKEQWQAKIKNYEVLKSKLTFSDKDDVEEIVSDYLSKEQMGAILNVCDNPALVMYALSKSNAKLEELSKTKDYLKFAAQIAKIESSIKISKKTSRREDFDEDINPSNTKTSNQSSVSIKKMIDKAIATEGGIYKLLKERPDLQGKIAEYL